MVAEKMRRAIEGIEQARGRRPMNRRDLERWVLAFTGIRVPAGPSVAATPPRSTCSPARCSSGPPLALWHGPRGSGKCFLSAIDTHLASRFNPRHGTRILGGSLAQSEQIHQALQEAILRRPRADGGVGRRQRSPGCSRTRCITTTAARSRSWRRQPTSVRGPHVPSLKLDEVDEIDSDIREAAMGMAMEVRGCTASRADDLDLAPGGRPDGRADRHGAASRCVPGRHVSACSRSWSGAPRSGAGRAWRTAPSVLFVAWCHSDRDAHPSGLPKAKRSAGHYTIDSLIQKVKAVSLRVFESDYLCLRPRAAGIWFTMFDEPGHVTTAAELQPGLAVHLAVDPGVHTGAVWFQVRPRLDGRGPPVNVFADYFAEGVSAEANARAIGEQSRQLCGIGMQTDCGSRWTRPARADGRRPDGPRRVRAGRAARAGTAWSTGPAAQGRRPATRRGPAQSADGTVNLTIHPRCRRLITALQCYARARRADQWMDYPEDPQHPHEDLVDPLCGGLKLEFPAGPHAPRAAVPQGLGSDGLLSIALAAGIAEGRP